MLRKKRRTKTKKLTRATSQTFHGLQRRTVPRGFGFHGPLSFHSLHQEKKYVIGHHSGGWIGCLRDESENIWLCHFLTNTRLVTTSAEGSPDGGKMCNTLRRDLPIIRPRVQTFDSGSRELDVCLRGDCVFCITC